MGLFTKKPKVNLETLFKEKYKKLNQLNMQAHNELDYTIKESLYKLVVDEYDELLSLIDQGAPFDKQQFTHLKNDAYHQYITIHNLNKE